MQPLRLTVPGEFWDSYVYRGRLYLWRMDGSLAVLDWDRAITMLSTEADRLVLTCAFTRGDLFYLRTMWQVIFEDPDVQALIKQKFRTAAVNDIVVDPGALAAFEIGRQDSPFGLLHDDVAMYGSTLFALTERGLFGVGAHKNIRNVYKVERKSTKLWDGGGMCIRPGRAALAIAAGDDGLFELPIHDGHPEEPSQIAARHATSAEWAFTSVYATSARSGGYLVGYGWERETAEDDDTPWRRVRAGIFDEDEVFGGHASGISWGAEDKLYRLSGRHLLAVQFIQSHILNPEERAEAFMPIGEIHVAIQSPPIAAGTTFFGTIVEYDQALVVIDSTEESHVIQGPVLRWRVFPRADRYQNHLHVVFPDRLEILSFNNDYFVDQEKKRLGIRFRAPGPRYRRGVSLNDLGQPSARRSRRARGGEVLRPGEDGDDDIPF